MARTTKRRFADELGHETVAPQELPPRADPEAHAAAEIADIGLTAAAAGRLADDPGSSIVLEGSDEVLGRRVDPTIGQDRDRAPKGIWPRLDPGFGAGEERRKGLVDR